MPRPKQMTSPQRSNAKPRAIESSVQPRIASSDPTATPSGDPVPATMPALQLGNDDEFWSIKTVAQKTGLSRASIYRYVARNLFPARRRIGPGRIAWLASEVISWMQSRPRPGTPS
jgi:predicted DNA-binding transcriptional regulator AlpA